MNIKKLKIGFNGLNYQQKSGNQSNLLGFKNLASASKTINSNATLDKSANSTIIDQKEDYNRLSSPEHTQKINLLGIFSSDKRDGSKTFVKDFQKSVRNDQNKNQGLFKKWSLAKNLSPIFQSSEQDCGQKKLEINVIEKKDEKKNEDEDDKFVKKNIGLFGINIDAKDTITEFNISDQCQVNNQDKKM